MTFVKDTFFGGAEKKAAKAQTRGLEQGQEFIRAGVSEARGDISRLFPQAALSAQQGFQGALDVFGQALPQQAQALTGGNVAAQQALLAGLPQIQQAILGGNVNLAALQPFQAQQPDFSFAQQAQLPNFATPQFNQPQQTGIATPQSPLSGALGRKFTNFGRR